MKNRSIIEVGGYIFFKYDVQSPELYIPTGGYTSLSMHISFAKSIYSCVSWTNSLTLTNINILCLVQIVSNPWNPTYFTNINTARKNLTISIMGEIEIYFTDIWRDLITDAIDFQICTYSEKLCQRTSRNSYGSLYGISIFSTIFEEMHMLVCICMCFFLLGFSMMKPG